MPCERGCEGTPICSALDICCIQFRNDCGKECAGVAVGFGTIQIDADGELVVCANVGGVCTCVSPVTGTDILIEVPAVPDTSAQYYQHTALDGVIQTFTLCKQLAVSFNRPPGADDDPCNSSGLGEFCTDSVWVYDPTQPGADTGLYGFCERKWHRIGGNCNTDEWVEQTVPEPVDHIVYNGVNLVQQTFDPYVVNPKDTWNDIGVDAVVTLDNPSDCWPMRVLINAEAARFSFFNNNLTDPLIASGVQLYIDGVPFGISSNITAETNVGNNRWHSHTPSSFGGAVLVPAGGTITVRLQPVINERGAFGIFNGVINIAAFGLNLLGIIEHPA